jgi:mRNA interferase RelE/StbE
MWNVEFASSFRRELRKLDSSVRQRIGAAIETLAKNPFAPGAEKLKGKSRPVYRRRVGSFRYLYEIETKSHTLIFTAVGDRKEIYRD